MAKKKIYAVRKGHKTGLFYTWDECKKAVYGYSGAEYEPKEEVASADDQEVNIIRTKKFGIKPMYPEDACVQMELLGHDFFVFINAETEDVNVVYKRKGNTYGLIEPEF